MLKPPTVLNASIWILVLHLGFLPFPILWKTAQAQFPADHFDPLEPSAVVELPGTQRLTLQGDIASELV